MLPLHTQTWPSSWCRLCTAKKRKMLYSCTVRDIRCIFMYRQTDRDMH